MKRLPSLSLPGLSPIIVKVGLNTVHLLQMKFHQGAAAECFQASAPIVETGDDRSAAVESAVRAALAKAPFKGRKASLCLCGDDLLIQHQRVALGEGEENENVIQQKIYDELRLSSACDIDNSYTSYLPVGEVFERHERKRELILVVVNTAVVDRYLALFKALHLELHNIAVEPFALHRAYLRFFPGEWVEGGPTAIVNVGEAKVEVLIVRKKKVSFVRSLPVGVDKLTGLVAKRMGIDKEGMARIVQAMGDGTRVNETVQKAVHSAVRPDMEFLCSEILTCFRYFSANHNREPVARALVVGRHMAELAGKNFIQERIGVPVEFPRDAALGRGRTDEDGEETDAGGDPPAAGEAGERLGVEFLSLAGLAATLAAGRKPVVDFLPQEVEERRLRVKVNRLRMVYVGATLLLMVLFYCKSSQRLTMLNNINDMYVNRSNLLQLSSKAVDDLNALTAEYRDKEQELGTTICPLLPTRVLAEVVCAAGPAISLSKITADFSYGKTEVAAGKKNDKTRTVSDYSRPILCVSVSGKAARAEEISLFAERLKGTAAFSSVQDEGSAWDGGGEVRDADQKQFTIKLAVGEEKKP